jgi:hypothetical protein
MEAYVLIYREKYEGDTLLGVYTTLDKAKEAKEKARNVGHVVILGVDQDEDPIFDVGAIRC